MKRSEAYWILNEMYADANEIQRQAISIAQYDIECVDLWYDLMAEKKYNSQHKPKEE